MCAHLFLFPKKATSTSPKKVPSSSSLRKARGGQAKDGPGGSCFIRKTSSSSRLCVFSCKNSVVVAQEEPLSSLLIVGEQNLAGGLSLSLWLALMTHTKLPSQGRTREVSVRNLGFPPRVALASLYANS